MGVIDLIIYACLIAVGPLLSQRSRVDETKPLADHGLIVGMRY